jgi:Na+-transporting methylmalonyl-CoA/oxaloacetate decarboxylase gamma subunit
MVFSLLIFLVRIIGDIRRQFRSPTFRQYGQMKSRDGKSQRREKKKEDQKRESLRRKKIQVREKVGKLRNIVFFP